MFLALQADSLPTELPRKPEVKAGDEKDLGVITYQLDNSDETTQIE